LEYFLSTPVSKKDADGDFFDFRLFIVSHNALAFCKLFQSLIHQGEKSTGKVAQKCKLKDASVSIPYSSGGNSN